MTASELNTLKPQILGEPLFELVMDRFANGEQSQWLDYISVQGDKANFFWEILQVFEEPTLFDAERLKQFSLDIILEYLQYTHQYYQNKRLNEIEQSINLLCENYATRYPALSWLMNYFKLDRDALIMHIKEEEVFLFPYVRSLMSTELEPEMQPAANWPHLSLDSFLVSHESHQHELKMTHFIDILLNFYPELGDSFLFKILHTQLNVFEKDLHIHSRVEEEVLIPAAKQMEKH